MVLFICSLYLDIDLEGYLIVLTIINLDLIYMKKGAQWLSGRVLDSRLRGRGLEPLHRVLCP